VRAETINSKIGTKDRKRILLDLATTSPDTKLLYITPEQAATEYFQVKETDACLRLFYSWIFFSESVTLIFS